MKKRITYDDSLAHRNTLMGVGTFDPDKWSNVEKSFHEHEAAFRLRDRAKRKVGWLICLVLIVAMVSVLVLGNKGNAATCGIALIASLMLGASFLYSVREGERHLMSAFGPSDFEPIKVTDYPEAWRICAADEECFEYVSAAMAARGELLFIELVVLRHRSHELRLKQELNAGKLTKEMLASTDPEIKQLLMSQAAAIEFYRTNPTAALFDFDKRLRSNKPQA